jgi:hypothetical protein
VYRTKDRAPDPERGVGGQGDGVLRKADRRCSAGKRCVSHAALGGPAKLSRGNRGTLCFACEERRAANEMGGAAKPAAVLREEREPRTRGEGRKSADRTGGVGKDHDAPLKVRRAREWREGRAGWALTCERNLRDALAAGDEALARKWSSLSEGAEAALAVADADLAAAEARARLGPGLSYETPWRAGATLQQPWTHRTGTERPSD